MIIKMYRTNLDHNAEILQISKDGARKTVIVYGANLNFYVVKKRLTELIGSGLILKNGKYYITTPKGDAFLYHYREMRSLISID